jgi:hypothetical protein
MTVSIALNVCKFGQQKIAIRDFKNTSFNVSNLAGKDNFGAIKRSA